MTAGGRKLPPVLYGEVDGPARKSYATTSKARPAFSLVYPVFCHAGSGAAGWNYCLAGDWCHAQFEGIWL
jgi:hypothetical protein